MLIETRQRRYIEPKNNDSCWLVGWLGGWWRWKERLIGGRTSTKHKTQNWLSQCGQNTTWVGWLVQPSSSQNAP